jgi:hypothetical protein
MPSPEPIRELLQQSASTSYCRPALRALGESLPADDTTLHEAMDFAAAMRDAKAFSHLYIAALLAGRRIPATVLELGVALLPDAMLLLHSAMRLDGNVAESLAAAVRSGRMGNERDAIALAVSWLACEHHDIAPPADLRILTRKACRECSRMGGAIARPILCVAAKLANDPVAASILRADIANDRGLDTVLKEFRKNADGGNWQNILPNSPVIESALGHGATLKRAAPKAGRNDPCPCGSGKKFKQCCEGKASITEQYQVDGITLSEAEADPERFLTREGIRTMRSYELYTLDPHRLIPPLAAQVAARLVLFGEIPRAIEMLKVAGQSALSPMLLDEIIFDLQRLHEEEALRWLVDWADADDQLSFESTVLLARPEERMQLLQQRIREAIEAEKSDPSSAEVIYADIGFAALTADPALGLLIARGALPVCGIANQSVLIEEMENARDMLGLDNNEPGYDILDTTERASLDEERHAADLEKIRKETAARVTQREAEIAKLKSRIDAMEETLVQRERTAAEDSARPRNRKKSAPTPPPSPHDPAESRELREQLRRLKDNLKVEHEERNRALRDLRTAQEQLRRAPRETTNPSPETNHTDPTDEGLSNNIGDEWERQPLRIPEYGKAFREALHHHPRPAAAAAITAAGRLAAGDPSIWKTVRALRMRPGTLRVRIAGDYRLLFETGPADTLHIIDLILRRDLDRWLSAGG